MGEGAFTDDPLETFGGAGVVEIPRLQNLLRYICENGFEHHVAANLSAPSAALSTRRRRRYLGWEMYWHQIARSRTMANYRRGRRFRHAERPRLDRR